LKTLEIKEKKLKSSYFEMKFTALASMALCAVVATADLNV